MAPKNKYYQGITLFLFIIMGSVSGQTDTAVILTSAQCSMCKNRIERVMAFEKGVLSSHLDMETRKLTVLYKSKKTNRDKIKKSITLTGYDADDMKATLRVYNKLPACCKKSEDPEYKRME